MAPIATSLSFIAYSLLLHHTSKASAAAIDKRASNSYAPVTTACPSTSIVRSSSSGISTSESDYITSRKSIADSALSDWLANTNSSFDTTSLPTLAFAVSGGGLRSALCGAGVLQAFDSRDSSSSTSGIFQSFTYHAGLSGGAWFLGSLAGNNWPTISSLVSDLWSDTLEDSLFDPENLLAALAYIDIVEDIIAKNDAGFEPTLIDVYGRLLGFELLESTNGGEAQTLSSLTSLSNFTSYSVPFPIITALGTNYSTCIPTVNATQYEFTPYEFGSWDSGVAAFAETAYLGSNLTDGEATVSGVCVTNYDNLGYIMGTSSDVFDEVCSVIPAVNSTTELAEVLSAIILNVHDPVLRDIYAAYPNPFYGYTDSSSISSESELYLVDGGESDENVPLWPLIQDARSVDVIIANDNSADTDDDFPNGTEVRHTYVRAQELGLTKMPFIPTVDVFVDQGLNKRATFFGCNDTETVTIVYLPNVNYTYASDTSTYMLEYTSTETSDMIANANLIATQDDDSEWPVCLGCAIMMKTGTTLPSACTACFETYCYYE